MTRPDFMFADDSFTAVPPHAVSAYESARPFAHVVLDDFLPEAHARWLSDHFPGPEHPVWLDWRRRSGHQYGKQGPGNADRFDSLEPEFELALQQFNSHRFLRHLEKLTGVEHLLPDPYFKGGGMHQILPEGFLDVHTDFNENQQLQLVRRLNVLIYLNEGWQPGWGGELELWNGPKETGSAVDKIAPLYNRCVIFSTDKTSFHGHPSPWSPPHGRTRRSIALYYYTSARVAGLDYDTKTNFQNVAFREVPGKG
jgi:hypothetical protein